MLREKGRKNDQKRFVKLQRTLKPTMSNKTVDNMPMPVTKAAEKINCEKLKETGTHS